MALFGYDRDVVDEAMNEGHQIMADLVARLRRADARVARLGDERDDLRDRLKEAKREHDASERRAADWRRDARDLERRLTEALELNRGLERERDAALRERDQAEGRCQRLEDDKRDLDLQVAELMGVAKGLAAIVASYGAPRPAADGNGGDADVAPPDGKAGRRTLTEQAALARVGKTNLSPEARIRVLQEAERLGVLPQFEPELKALEE